MSETSLHHCGSYIATLWNKDELNNLFICFRFRHYGRIWAKNWGPISWSLGRCQGVDGKTGVLRLGKVNITVDTL